MLCYLHLLGVERTCWDTFTLFGPGLFPLRTCRGCLEHISIVHAIRQWVRNRDVITGLDIAKMWRATRKIAFAEMRKCGFVYQAHSGAWLLQND